MDADFDWRRVAPNRTDPFVLFMRHVRRAGWTSGIPSKNSVYPRKASQEEPLTQKIR
jgi:hypothetical protein